MQITHTANQDETSVTCTRPDSTKIDFCYMTDGEIVIGETQGEDHHHIVLSLQEARALAHHLASVLHI